MVIKLRTSIPGPKSARILDDLKNKNGGWGVSHPLVFSGRGLGPYCRDIDGNTFLDFASQIASNPLGYNNSELVDVLRQYTNRFPIKYAGQDFTIEEHLNLIETLTGISPSGMDTAFIVNSGSEAVENAIKISMRNRPKVKFGVSVSGAFHGRTLGALSLNHSKKIHRQGYTLLPNIELPFGDEAGDALEKTIRKHGNSKIGFLILEHFQGEGGYRIPTKKMVKDLRRIAEKHSIPYIADEVQSGMGRTGKWWSFQHYGIKPDVFSSAKALQVGAIVANRKWFPKDPGAISSTWGGGPIIDMAIGMKTIEIIKKRKLLERNVKIGDYCMKRLDEIRGIFNIRGRGLMIGFDLANKNIRDNVVIECAKRGLLVLGTGEKSIRVIPPYIILKDEVDEGMKVIEDSVKTCNMRGFRHKGKICNYMICADGTS